MAAVPASAVSAPGVSLSKSANVAAYSAAGTVITYTYTVSNTGSSTLTNVTVTDPMAGLSAINCGGNSDVIASLAPFSSQTCTATYTTTANDVQAGSISNVGTVTGMWGPVGATVSATASLTIPESGDPFTCVNPVIFLSQGTSTQLKTGTEGSAIATFTNLGSGAGFTYNALGYDATNGYLYAITTGPDLLRIDASGAVTNLGTVTGTGTTGGFNVGAFDGSGNYWITRTGTSTAYMINLGTRAATAVPLTPAVSGGIGTFGADDWSWDAGYFWGLSGTTIYRVDTSGHISTFSALGSGIVSSASTVFGAAWTYGNGNLGFSNNVSGEIYEVAVTYPAANPPTFSVVSSYIGPVAGPTNDGAACVGKPTDLGITKTGPATVAPEGTITWQITVTNIGPANSSGFAVNDAVPAGITGVTSSTPGCTVTGNNVQCSEGALTVGSSFVITLTGRAPKSLGACITNTASVIGNEADPVTQNNSSSATTCTPASIALVKSANVTGFTGVGEQITYSYTVTNTSTTETLTNVTVTDPMTGLSAINCGGNSDVIASLAPGASQTCTATYTTTQGDLDAGSITNIGTATGTTPSDSTISTTSTLTIPAIDGPAVTLVKTADVQGYSAAGTVVTYTYTVTNTGTVTLFNVTVTDPMTGLSAINCGGNSNVIASLALGASQTCTATYTTTQADVGAGSITNVGTATALWGPADAGVSSSSSVTIPETGDQFTCQTPVIFLAQGVPSSLLEGTESSATATFTQLGPTASQTYNAIGFDTNNGYLYGIASGPTLLRIDATGAITSLGTITGTGTTTGFNVGAFDGSGNYWITKTGTSTAYMVDLTTRVATAVPLTPEASGGIGTYGASDWSWDDGYFWGLVGTTIYRVSTAGVMATFPAPSGVSGTASTIYGAAWTYGNGNLGFSNNVSGEIYEISVTNASVNPPGSPGFSVVSAYQGPPAGESNDGAACPGEPTDLSIAKTGPKTVKPGGTIAWQITVTNNGPGNSSGFAVDDAVPAGVTGVSSLTPGCTVTGNSVVCSEGALADGSSFVITLTGTAPATNGTCVTNTASVIGNEADPVTDNNSSSVTTCTTPVIVVKKSASSGTFSETGQTIKYAYLVTNANTNDALSTVTLTDSMTGLSAIKCGKGGSTIKVLDAGASETCTASYKITQGDLNAGSITNTAVGKGTDTNGNLVTGDSNTVVVSYVGVQILTTSLAVAEGGLPYYAPLVATGGTAPYTWKSSGHLPPGLKLSSSGYISGTPTTAGTYTFTVKATGTDAKKQTPTQSLSIVVSPPIPVITSVNPSSGPAGGGTKVTITGANLTGVKEVFFGSTAGEKTMVAKSGTSLVVVAPPGTAGTVVDVSLSIPSGGTATASDAYTYG